MTFSDAERQACLAVLQPPSTAPTSSVYHIIPAVLRTRLPNFTSIRKSSKSIIWRPRTLSRSWSSPGSYQALENESVYSSATGPVTFNATSTPRDLSTTNLKSLPRVEESMGYTSGKKSQSGVNWDIAATGVRLWIAARAQAEQNTDASALRSMHIDALRYMHMALPKDLTSVEVHSIQSSLPLQISSPLENPGHEQTRNMLRQATAWAVCWLVAALLFFVPLCLTFLSNILQYERRHHLTERVMSNGLGLTNSLGVHGGELQVALSRFRKGPVGGVCYDAGSWLLEGIVGGVNDGLAQSVNTSRRL